MFQDNLELFKADASSDMWNQYVDYVDEMIVEGFFNTIHCSLKFLLDNTDPKNNPDGLFKAQLELQSQEMIFIPSLDFGVPEGFYDLVDGLVGDIYKQSSLIECLSTHSGQEHYQPDLEDMEELSEMRQVTCNRVPTRSGNYGKPGKSLKKSSMHGKIMEFEKNRIIIEKSWNFVKYDKTTSCQKTSCRTHKCPTASFQATGGFQV